MDAVPDLLGGGTECQMGSPAVSKAWSNSVISSQIVIESMQGRSLELFQPEVAAQLARCRKSNVIVLIQLYLRYRLLLLGGLSMLQSMELQFSPVHEDQSGCRPLVAEVIQSLCMYF